MEKFINARAGGTPGFRRAQKCVFACRAPRGFHLPKPHGEISEAAGLAEADFDLPSVNGRRARADRINGDFEYLINGSVRARPRVPDSLSRAYSRSRCFARLCVAPLFRILFHREVIFTGKFRRGFRSRIISTVFRLRD